jgi:FKBP-type peptidyl-prolyl cis-trans isomerase SlyD
MEISKNTVVSLHYKLFDKKGPIIEESQEPMMYLHGGYGNIFPQIEAALEGKAKGYGTKVELQPEDAFGEYDEADVRVEPRDRFPENLVAGMRFEGAPEGLDVSEPRLYTVTEVTAEHVVVDGNHPLAGLTLVFDLTVVDVRQAEDEELVHGHAHGAGGHHH